MCQAEGVGMLQQGMRFASPPNHGVILMSERPNAPYVDAVDADGNLLYEGHDVPRSERNPEPKQVDQPRAFSNGRLTQNGKFAEWTEAYRAGKAPAALFHVYQKLLKGIWTFRGPYLLKDYQFVRIGPRSVFRFILAPTQADSEWTEMPAVAPDDDAMTRQIPTWVKQAVYKRDKGKCVICGSDTQLHFDHELPFSKGGTSISPDNIRLLCARHNLSKGDRIE